MARIDLISLTAGVSNPACAAECAPISLTAGASNPPCATEYAPISDLPATVETVFSRLINKSLSELTGANGLMAAPADSLPIESASSLPPELPTVDTEAMLGGLSDSEILDLLNGSLPGAEAALVGIESEPPTSESSADIASIKPAVLPQLQETAAQLETLCKGLAKEGTTALEEVVREAAVPDQAGQGEVKPAIKPESEQEDSLSLEGEVKPAIKSESEQEDSLSLDLPLTEALLAFMIPAMIPALKPGQLEQQPVLADPFPSPDGGNDLQLPSMDSEGGAIDLAPPAPLASFVSAAGQDQLGSGIEFKPSQDSPLPDKFHLSSAIPVEPGFNAQKIMSAASEFGKEKDIAQEDGISGAQSFQINLSHYPLLNAAPATNHSPMITPPVAVSGAEANSSMSTPGTPDQPLEVTQVGWGEALGQQLVWMVHHRAHRAELKISPPHLGPLEIHLSLDQDQTNVAFFCHEASVREVLESALPKLREMLDNQGIQLHQANVSDQSLAHRHGYGGQWGSRRSWIAGGDEIAAAESSTDQPLGQRATIGMVDHYV